MNKSQIIEVFNQDQRINLAYPNMRREVRPEVVRHIDLSDTMEGFITFSQLNDINADDVIREQVAYYKDIGQSFEWKVYDYDRPNDLKERLASHGFSIGEAEALVVLNVESAPDFLYQPISHDVRRIIGPEKLVDVQRIEEQVWDEDASWVHNFLGDFLRNNPDLMSVYVAYIKDEPASAAWTYFQENSQFASLWGGATVGHFRKQGLYTALLAVRLQEAKARQIKYLTVDASPMSRPILEKFGFEKIAYNYACKWELQSQK